MTNRRISAHPILEPLDYKITPEIAASFLSSEELEVYDLLWKAGLSTGLDGPAVRFEHVTVRIETTDGAPFFLRMSQASILEFGWGELLPTEVEKFVQSDPRLFAPFPEEFLKGIEQSGPSTLNAEGGRFRGSNQMTSLTEALPPPRDWKTEVCLKSRKAATLDSVLPEMETNGIGRPSSFAERLQAAIESGLIQETEGLLSTGEYGRKILDLLEKLEPSSVVGVKFSSDLQRALSSIESDPSLAGRVLDTFCQRAVGQTTQLSDWVDSIVLEGECLTQALERANSTLPPATGWKGIEVASGLTPDNFLEDIESAEVFRQEVDKLLAGEDIQAWRKLSSRERAAVRFLAICPSAPKDIRIEDFHLASRDILLRWWIDLSPTELPFTRKEMSVAQAFMGSRDARVHNELNGLMERGPSFIRDFRQPRRVEKDDFLSPDRG